LNAFVGQERAIVSPISGTTRDAIDTVVEREGQTYRLMIPLELEKRNTLNTEPNSSASTALLKRFAAPMWFYWY
jgi:GTP-binding protein